MGQNEENEKIEIYEIENKKYTVVTKCIEEKESIDKLYNLLCKHVISRLNKE